MAVKLETMRLEKKVEKISKPKNLSNFKKTIELDFFTPKARLAFTKVRQVFVKAPIFHYFKPKRHIQVETDISGYLIDRVFSQLTSDDLGQWHLVAFFLQKMILAETRYETYNGKFLAIVEVFKIWRYYLE